MSLLEGRIRGLHARGLLGEAQRDASLAPPAPEQAGPIGVFRASPLGEGLTGRLLSAVGG